MGKFIESPDFQHQSACLNCDHFVFIDSSKLSGKRPHLVRFLEEWVPFIPSSFAKHGIELRWDGTPTQETASTAPPTKNKQLDGWPWHWARMRKAFKGHLLGQCVCAANTSLQYGISFTVLICDFEVPKHIWNLPTFALRLVVVFTTRDHKYSASLPSHKIWLLISSQCNTANDFSLCKRLSSWQQEPQWYIIVS